MVDGIRSTQQQKCRFALSENKQNGSMKDLEKKIAIIKSNLYVYLLFDMQTSYSE